MDERLELSEGRLLLLDRGDITRVNVDAIVNAANEQLSPGGGVSGAIHSAGGPSIAEEGRRWVAEHGPVKSGEAAITTAGHLPARYVIHAVGPVWHGGDSREPERLANAYRSGIELADRHHLNSIAFPSISTGIFGYPVEQAAPVALEATSAGLTAARSLREVRFVLYDQPTYEAYARSLHALGTP